MKELGLESVLQAKWRMLRVLARTEYRHLASHKWKPYSRLFMAGDDAGWSLSWDSTELLDIVRGLGLSAITSVDFRRWKNQCAFLVSRYFLLNDDWLTWRNRLAFPYYHGLPGSGVKEFDRCYEALRAHHDRIARVQVTHQAMREVLLSSGIDPAKVFLIRIGVNLDFFRFCDDAMRRNARRTLNLPESAFVVGSFVKDGEGWGEGDRPKRIKGPDVLVDSLRRVRLQVPELHVLLSGPARGYVKERLQTMGIPFRHVALRHYPDIARLYHASDVCLVTSRQEGGPKAILEAMATGTPIVSTRVGQATELIQHGVNGWLADVEDTDLASHVVAVRETGQQLDTVRREGRRTAEANSYANQLPQWKEFFDGFVVGPS